MKSVKECISAAEEEISKVETMIWRDQRKMTMQHSVDFLNAVMMLTERRLDYLLLPIKMPKTILLHLKLMMKIKHTME